MSAELDPLLSGSSVGTQHTQHIISACAPQPRHHNHSVPKYPLALCRSLLRKSGGPDMLKMIIQWKWCAKDSWTAQQVLGQMLDCTARSQGASLPDSGTSHGNLARNSTNSRDGLKALRGKYICPVFFIVVFQDMNLSCSWGRFWLSALHECNFTVYTANANLKATPECAPDQHQCYAFSGLCNSLRLVQAAFAEGSN